MGLFKKGYDPVREEKQRQDENREKRGKQMYRFFLKGDGDEAEGQFLTEEPVSFYEHTIKGMNNGKETYDTVICTGDDCDLCHDGDRPTFKGAFLFWDSRPFKYKDKDGKEKESEGQLRLYVQGAKVLSQLDRISSKYGLSKRVVTIARAGKGTQTSYIIDRGDENKLTSQEITNMLPEKLRDQYNGTMDSLYDIVEEQLRLSMKDSHEDDSDDDEDEAPAKKEYNKNLVNIDSDEDEAPVRSTSVPKMRPKSSSAKASLFKQHSKPHVENSIKPLFSKINK